MEDFLPYLPVVMRASSLSWPARVVKILRKVEGGQVQSGEDFSGAVSDLRDALSLSSTHFFNLAHRAYAVFFHNVLSTVENRTWFEVVVPQLAKLLLRLPSLLEAHYDNAKVDIHGNGDMLTTCLRILNTQQPGIVFLDQELIAAFLACSLFSLFPDNDRHLKHLPPINFDQWFAFLLDSCDIEQTNKFWCIFHYFQRITSNMPKGMVSFERKILPSKNDSIPVSNLDSNFWSASTAPLCKFEVHSSGAIEDQSNEDVEVSFAGKTLVGDALGKGSSQDEICLMLSPEVIAGMLFLPAMADNEAIEIVGAEKFSTYAAFKSSFRFSGVYVDKSDIDTFGRRKTRIVACVSEMRQYSADFLLREINKAFRDFCLTTILQDNIDACTSTPMETTEGKFSNSESRNSQNEYDDWMDESNNIGVTTRDWEYGVFGKDPVMKAIIQWLAASQAQRPFIDLYTFGSEELQHLSKVCGWILSQGWTVGELWKMVIEYPGNRSKGESSVRIFEWLQLS